MKNEWRVEVGFWALQLVGQITAAVGSSLNLLGRQLEDTARRLLEHRRYREMQDQIDAARSQGSMREAEVRRIVEAVLRATRGGKPDAHVPGAGEVAEVFETVMDGIGQATGKAEGSDVPPPATS